MSSSSALIKKRRTEKAFYLEQCQYKNFLLLIEIVFFLFFEWTATAFLCHAVICMNDSEPRKLKCL